MPAEKSKPTKTNTQPSAPVLEAWPSIRGDNYDMIARAAFAASRTRLWLASGWKCHRRRVFTESIAMTADEDMLLTIQCRCPDTNISGKISSSVLNLFLV
jgi:hypothetical protein